MKTWTVQCGYAAYYANTVTVEAVTVEQALDKAIAQANDDSSWKSLDHCGPTFIDAVTEGDGDPWKDFASAIPVPSRFTERGKPPTVTVAVSDGVLQVIGIEHGPARIVLRDYDIENLDPDHPSIRIDEDGDRYVLAEGTDEFPPQGG